MSYYRNERQEMEAEINALYDYIRELEISELAGIDDGEYAIQDQTEQEPVGSEGNSDLVELFESNHDHVPF